jgi:hypothetical protein
MIDRDTVRLGRALRGTDTLMPVPDPTRPTALGLVFHSGQRLRIACDPGADCPAPVVPADSIRGEPVRAQVSRIISAVAAVVRETPGRYESLMSRGRPGPREMVLRLEEAGRVSMDSLLAGWPAGRYVWTLRSLRPEGGQGRIVIDWDPEAPPRDARPSAVSPGLYEATLADAPAPAGTGARVWLLLAEPGSYDELRDAFAAARDITESWGEEATESDIAEFLRAYLDVLSRGGGE